MKMNRFERWFLKRLCRKLVIQGPTHRSNVIEYIKTIMLATREQFTEDNRVTHDSFLDDCCKEAKISSYDEYMHPYIMEEMKKMNNISDEDLPLHINDRWIHEKTAKAFRNRLKVKG